MSRRRKRLAWPLVLSLVFVALGGLLTLLAFVALSHAGEGLRDDGHLINVAGRQRMLSQQISLDTAEVLAAPDATARATARTQLADVVDEMRQRQRGIVQGDADLRLPPTTDLVRQWYTEAGGADLGAALDVFWADAAVVADGSASGPAVQEAAARVRAAAAGPLLADLDTVVTRFDQGSSDRLDDFHRLVLSTGAGVFLTGGAVVATVSALVRRDRLRLVAARAEALASQSELAVRTRFADSVLATVGAGVVAVDPAGRIVVRNPAHRRMSGIGPDAPIDAGYYDGRTATRSADGTVLVRATSPVSRALAGEAVDDLVVTISHPVEGPRELIVSAQQITDTDGSVLGAVAVATDITAERRVQQQLRAAADFQAAVLTASPDTIYVVDLRTGKHVWTSRSLVDMLGYTPAQLAELGEDLYTRLVHPDDVDATRAGNLEVADLPDGALFRQRYRVQHADGGYRWLSRRLTPFRRTAEGTVVEALGVARDVTSVVVAEDALRRAALHDPLTGLPNRLHLAETMAGVLAAATGEVALLFCDLDGFKAVNDTGGHAAGDAVLVATGARLRSAVRPGDLVARVGGDEFVVLLVPPAGGETPEAPAAGPAAVRVAERISAALQQPVPHGGVQHRVTVSTGITLVAPGTDPDSALAEADTAMYEAKQRGKNQHRLVATPR